MDLPAAYLPDDLRAAPMSFAPRAVLPDLHEVARALLGDGLPLGKEQALAACVLHLRAAGLLRSRILFDEGARETAQLAREFIEAHADCAPTLGDLAVATGRSRFTVIRAFRRRYGVTPHAYLVQLKIERSRALLADGATPGLVAGIMGFSDQAHFTRAFGSILGLGPGRYRARVAQPMRSGPPAGARQFRSRRSRATTAYPAVNDDARLRSVNGPAAECVFCGSAGGSPIAPKARRGMPMTPQHVTFDSGGIRLTGHLYQPASAAGTRLPAVVVTGSWLTVKEQMPARYARLVAEAGFVALTFDFRGFGESAGEPREVESPVRKAEDIAAAARFLAQLPQVDPERIGALPICASAGYASVASLSEPRIRTIAMVAPWLHDRAIVEAFYGGEAGVERRRAAARAARAMFERSGTIDYVKAASSTDSDAAMYMPADVLDYYLNPARGAVPQWGGRFAIMAWEEWLTFDPIAIADRVPVPVRLVTGPGTATPAGAQRFAQRMTAPHDVVSLPGTQFHFYDDPATVRQAAALAVDHLRKTLLATRAAADQDEAARAVVTRLLHGIDARRWDEVARLLGDEVVTDYTSLFGGEVQRQLGAALAETWRKLLTPLKATQHLLGPIDVVLNGGSARAECHVRAYHVAPAAPGGQEWMVAGHYLFDLAWRDRGWGITGMTLQTYYQTGNTRLLEETGRLPH